jgi:uncharacterized protein with ParB-like and HNH nuclease domain
MEAHTYTLKELMSRERRYVIPTFQRDYEWTKDEQWSLLFDDLQEVSERLEEARRKAEAAGLDPSKEDKRVGPHFLGAIVLDQLPSPAGGLDVRAVIDGQQRLTTIQLLLRGLEDALILTDSPRLKQVRRLLRNPEDVANGTDEQHKLWPRRRDRDVWRAVMGDGSVNESHGYFLARRYFFERSRDFIGDGEGVESRASVLMDATLDLFKLVVIDLEENDDAQVIFEVLNGRQTPLSASDLVKNLLFLRAERAHEENLEAVYEQYWSQFDQAWWKSEVGRGHAARRHTDMLLASWLTVASGEEASPSHLYGEIRRYVDGASSTVVSTLAEISRFAKEYRLINGEDADPNRRRTSAYERLNILGITTALPLLLWLRTIPPSCLSDADHLAAVVAIESFVVRRSLTGSQTRGYGQIFRDVLKAAKSAADEDRNVVDAIKGALVSNTQSRTWPSDEEMITAFTTRRFYGSDSGQKIRLLLGVIDSRLRANNPKAESATFNYESLSIEHIMPQSWTDHWGLPSDVSEAEVELLRQRRNEAVNRIGNLTLVTHALNSAQSNAAWPKKRLALHEHSTLMLNAHIVTNEHWDESSIHARALTLARLALEEWPGPPATEPIEYGSPNEDQLLDVGTPDNPPHSEGDIGQRTESEIDALVGQVEPWNENAFLAAIAARYGADICELCRDLVRWAGDHADEVLWVSGKQFGSMKVVVQSGRVRKTLFEPWMATNGGVMVDFGSLRSHSPFVDEDLRGQLIDKLNTIPAVQIHRDNLLGWPSIPYSALLAPGSRAIFFAAFEWAADLIRQG